MASATGFGGARLEQGLQSGSDAARSMRFSVSTRGHGRGDEQAIIGVHAGALQTNDYSDAAKVRLIGLRGFNGRCYRFGQLTQETSEERKFHGDEDLQFHLEFEAGTGSGVLRCTTPRGSFVVDS